MCTYSVHIHFHVHVQKSDCLGCAVLLCLVVCFTLLSSSFLPSHHSLKHVHVHVGSLTSVGDEETSAASCAVA